ncbi:MAG TPA: type II toxin-antitoxin system VapC family toxin [Novimethylophilus sp.]|jgi:PIN domain nuclease of toxin-antitoxin system|uniref:type II toxin-antitoxin system VapC family toxin n=1 Tax=Novimethylophilus sp. TaxID=2137426 RepID=UPI002F42C5FB
MTSAHPLLLLDTHVWLWFALGNAERLAASVREEIENAVHEGRLAVSAISVWEIGMLEAKGRIALGLPCEKWVAAALALPGLRLIGLEPEIAVASSRLPGELHGDPADRILAATVRARDAVLATADERLGEYGRAGFMRVLEVR